MCRNFRIAYVSLREVEETERIELVLDHVWVEAENGWLNLWMEVQGEWSALVGSLLIGCYGVDGRVVVKPEIGERVIEVGL